MLWLHLLVVGLISGSLAVELTFELPDNSVQCFHEDVRQGTKLTFQFQVLHGGKLDVDLLLTGPGNMELYRDQHKQFNSMTFSAPNNGVYSACFSNEFSTFSHKLIYMHFMVGEDLPVNYEAVMNLSSTTAVTKMEHTIAQIRTNLNTIADYQTHARLRENKARRAAVDLRGRVMSYSAIQSFAICSIFVTCVFIVRSFFNDKRSLR